MTKPAKGAWTGKSGKRPSLIPKTAVRRVRMQRAHGSWSNHTSPARRGKK